MADFADHRAAHRRLRTEAKARGCYVVCKPDTIVHDQLTERRDRYTLVDRDTGRLRGSFSVPPMRMTKEAVDNFFAEEFQ